MHDSSHSFPFVFGAQYYRAPTPDKSYWEGDLRRMAESGFNAVKFWAQWRWAHRSPGEFYFDDLDELMDISARQGLSVTFNTIFDVAPAWLYEAHCDCVMVDASGRRLEPRVVGCRQIGGYPGPCLNHPEARHSRMRFLKAVVERYADHPAMGMWDVWNEPESCLFTREPNQENLLCYCENCRRGFLGWLETRYGSIESLNRVWGRCYRCWDEVELPRDVGAFIDMIDWREFNCASLTREAELRIRVVKENDTAHPVYLHPVPNTLEYLNGITGPDDFRITEQCDCLAGTIISVPCGALQAVAPGRDRVTYNVECHLRAGSTSMFPRDLCLDDVVSSFVPQIGLGIRGFLFWQYRGETLGGEAPAWGLLDVDGTPGLTHQTVTEFWRLLKPFASRLMTARPETAEVAVWRSTANEIFHWCMHGNLTELKEGLHGYTRLLYSKNTRLSYVDDAMLTDGLGHTVKLLVMPNAYMLSQPVADAVAKWVSSGGTLLCEAHTGGYDRTTGRHSTTMPGLGLAEAFGLRERNATAVPHLGLSNSESFQQRLSPDLRKALEAYPVAGGNVLPLAFGADPFLGWSRYAELEGGVMEGLASLPGRGPCVARKRVGDGFVYYVGTLAGRMWSQGGSPGLEALVDLALESAGIGSLTEVPDGLRVDWLNTEDGACLAVTNSGSTEASLEMVADEPLIGVFTDHAMSASDRPIIGAGRAELFVPRRWCGVS